MINFNLKKLSVILFTLSVQISSVRGAEISDDAWPKRFWVGVRIPQDVATINKTRGYIKSGIERISSEFHSELKFFGRSYPHITFAEGLVNSLQGIKEITDINFAINNKKTWDNNSLKLGGSMQLALPSVPQNRPDILRALQSAEQEYLKELQTQFSQDLIIFD